MTCLLVVKYECVGVGMVGGTLSVGSIGLVESIDGWKDIIATPADQYGNFGNDAICSMFKLNGNGFRCFDKPKPPATKELAIQRYTLRTGRTRPRPYARRSS